MKKIIIASTLVAISLMAVDGHKVFQDKCSSCHAQELTKAFVLKNFNTMKAPPMIEVSNKVKDNIKIMDGDPDIHRRVVMAFVKDYIVNPSVQYSMCDPMPIEKFGIMPSLKGKITNEERDAVAEWVYDFYEGKKFQ